MDGNTYWYFYGTRLYKEEGKKKKKQKELSEEVSTPAAKKKGKDGALSTGKKKGAQNKATTFSSQRGRSKQVVQENATPTGAKGRRSARNSRKNHQAVEEGEDESYDGENEADESLMGAEEEKSADKVDGEKHEENKDEDNR
jgi:hypothetical protein